MRPSRLYLIGNAHIDPVWLWDWNEGFHEVHATFRSALDRLTEFDDFKFAASSAAFYEWIEAMDPAMFAEIQQRVREGRWELVGGWWIESDCNIPGGESFVRQALYAQRYFYAKFGTLATVGYNIDAFGHNGMMPQLMKKSGMDSYVFLRPGPHEKELPHVFWWESDDGSRVLAARILFEYCTWGKALDDHVRRCAQEDGGDLPALLCFYGVGNHGGGPTIENLQSIHRMRQDSGLPELIVSTPHQYFEEISHFAEGLPIIHDELQYHARGCYSAHSGIKKQNRVAEYLLLAAEKWETIRHFETLSWRSCMQSAWKPVLFNQFHDILAGTSLEGAYEEAQDESGGALAKAKRALIQALHSVSWRIPIEAEDGLIPLVVFNPHAWDSQVNVEIEVGQSLDNLTLTDDQDRILPFQSVRPQATANGRYRLSFTATLPSLGYRLYRLREEPSALTLPPTDAEWSAGSNWIENRWLRVEFSPARGQISRIWDKENAVEVLEEPAQARVFHDPSDTWSHGVQRYDQVAGDFAVDQVQLIEQGPVKSVMRVTSTYQGSTLVQDFILYREFRRIDVKARIDFHEKFSVLKVCLPTMGSADHATYETPYGYTVRDTTGEEVPAHGWTDLTGARSDSSHLYGLAVINDGKYSVSTTANTINLTILRSPIYAHHDPLVPDVAVSYSHLDQGVQEFSYALIPHVGTWQSAGIVQQAQEFNQAPFVVKETYHPGDLPPASSYGRVSAPGVLLTVLKQSEDALGIVIRCVEIHGLETSAEISLPQWGRSWKAAFKPLEIKTFFVPQDAKQAVYETNLLEFRDEDSPFNAEKGDDSHG